MRPIARLFRRNTSVLLTYSVTGDNSAIADRLLKKMGFTRLAPHSSSPLIGVLRRKQLRTVATEIHTRFLAAGLVTTHLFVAEVDAWVIEIGRP